MAENKKKIELEENEIMRLSVRKVDSSEGEYMSSFTSNGPQGPMVQALMDACEQLDLVCLPKGVLETLPVIAAICMLGNPFAFDEEDDGDGKKEESKG